MAGILKRLFQISKAKANQAVNALEDKDPIMMIENHLEQARQDLSQFESAVRDAGAEKIRLEKEVTRLKKEVKRWGLNAKTALEDGDEPLAEKALLRQVSMETELTGIQSQYKMAKSSFDKMTAKIIEQNGIIKTQESKMGSLKAKRKSTQANLKMRETIAKCKDSGTAFDQIARFEDKVNADCDKVQAADEIDEAVNGEDLDAQFANLESKSGVSDKLAALKASMGK